MNIWKNLNFFILNYLYILIFAYILYEGVNNFEYDKAYEILDHRTLKVKPNGRTPSVDGEAFDMVRSYTLRRSTVRILSKIKAIHIDDNVYLNTIVDEAIRYYYEYLKAQNN